MSDTCVVSTPAKLALFGEHAVVYGGHCIVTAVNKRMWVKIRDSHETILTSKDMGFDHYLIEKGPTHPRNAAFVIGALQSISNYFGRPFSGEIEIWSDFSAKYGLGSSSAVTVGVIKALAHLNNLKLDNDTLFRIAYDAVLNVQGRHKKSGIPLASGFDVASAIYGGTMDFSQNGKVRALPISDIPLIVAYSGEKASTAFYVNKVADLCAGHNSLCQSLFSISDEIVKLAESALLRRDWEEVGILMTLNHGLLSSLGVSTETLGRLVSIAIKEGAYGAKLSGAGGGDCVIAVAGKDSYKNVSEKLESGGAEILPLDVNAEGVKVEVSGN